jgi:hypothetical protein
MAQIINTCGQIIEVDDSERTEEYLENIVGGEYVVKWHYEFDDMIMVVGWNAKEDGKKLNKVASNIMGGPIWGDVLYGPSRISYGG